MLHRRDAVHPKNQTENLNRGFVKWCWECVRVYRATSVVTNNNYNYFEFFPLSEESYRTSQNIGNFLFFWRLHQRKIQNLLHRDNMVCCKKRSTMSTFFSSIEPSHLSRTHFTTGKLASSMACISIPFKSTADDDDAPFSMDGATGICGDLLEDIFRRRFCLKFKNQKFKSIQAGIGRLVGWLHTDGRGKARCQRWLFSLWFFSLSSVLQFVRQPI